MNPTLKLDVMFRFYRLLISTSEGESFHICHSPGFFTLSVQMNNILYIYIYVSFDTLRQVKPTQVDRAGVCIFYILTNWVEIFSQHHTAYALHIRRIRIGDIFYNQCLNYPTLYRCQRFWNLCIKPGV
jgi:hypothetical protein